jgi:hypothetical protein
MIAWTGGSGGRQYVATVAAPFRAAASDAMAAVGAALADVAAPFGPHSTLERRNS